MKVCYNINYKCKYIAEITIRNLIEGVLCSLKLIIRNCITAQISFSLLHSLIYNQSNQVSIIRKPPKKCPSFRILNRKENLFHYQQAKSIYSLKVNEYDCFNQNLRSRPFKKQVNSQKMGRHFAQNDWQPFLRWILAINMWLLIVSGRWWQAPIPSLTLILFSVRFRDGVRIISQWGGDNEKNPKTTHTV